MLGEDLRAWRQGHGWSQQRAADEMGYSRRQYIRLEQKAGVLPPHIERIVELIERKERCGNEETGSQAAAR